jgi:hypothetical protein
VLAQSPTRASGSGSQGKSEAGEPGARQGGGMSAAALGGGMGMALGMAGRANHADAPPPSGDHA